MSWMENLEYMEESVEKHEEKNIEKNTLSIDSVYDWENNIFELIETYKSVQELEIALGDIQDFTESYNIVFDEIRKLIAMGKTKFGISDDRIKEIFEQNNFSFNNDLEKSGKSI